MLGLGKDDLVVDIGSNDGTLISNFKNGGHRVLGIEPTDVAKIANERGIPTIAALFLAVVVAREVKRKHGAAKVITAANCFAHIEDVHAIVEGILEMMAPDGVFISESHYLIGLLDGCSTTPSIMSICATIRSAASPSPHMHGLEVFHARPIPSHGGSIRVYAARKASNRCRRACKRCSPSSRAATPCASASPTFRRRRDVVEASAAMR